MDDDLADHRADHLADHRGDGHGDEAPTCATCGRRAPDDDTWRLTWTAGIERGQEVWVCDRCSREHLRSIEAKLDSQWW